MPEPVKLYVYDLSQGMARSMSRQLTGKQIDGIWHTSVVVFGQEFYFGQGIMTSVPGKTQHGHPLEIIDIGETFLPFKVVKEYIYSLRLVYTAEKYHLLDFNCNTFSNDLCQFLCGKTIPSHITNLPTEFLNTPFGQSILPMIEGMFGQSKLNNSSAGNVDAQQPSLEAASLVQGISSAAASAAPTTVNPVQIANTAATVNSYISSYRAVVVFFTSAGCPPCRTIKPVFEDLIREKNGTSEQIKILGVILDISMAPDAAKYNIQVTPTFQLFLKGKKYSELKGVNYAELKNQVDILLFEAFPPHPHRKILLRTIVDQPNVPILYAAPGNWEQIYRKLNEFLEKNNIALDTDQKNVLDQSKRSLETKDPSGLNVGQWRSFVDLLVQKLAVDELFPLFDIYRFLLMSPTVSDFYVNDPSQITSILEIRSKAEALTTATWLMILKIACNIFANTTLSTAHFTSNLAASHRPQLGQLLVSSLLASNDKVRQAAASLAYNCSISIATERLEKEKGTFSGIAEQEDDDWEIELSSAVINALSKETDEDIIHRLLATIGKFLFLAPQDTSSIADLLIALDINNIIEQKKSSKVISSSKVLGLGRDICEMLKQQS